MNSTKFESFVLHHDGDFDGPMIISQGNLDPIASPEQEGAVQIIVTRLDIQRLLDGDTETVLLSGPDNLLYDRHEITTGKDCNEIAPGDYQMRTIEVSRKDLKRVILNHHASIFQELIEKIICIVDLDDFDFACNSFITLSDKATSLLQERIPRFEKQQELESFIISLASQSQPLTDMRLRQLRLIIKKVWYQKPNDTTIVDIVDACLKDEDEFVQMIGSHLKPFTLEGNYGKLFNS